MGCGHRSLYGVFGGRLGLLEEYLLVPCCNILEGFDHGPLALEL